MKIRLYITQKNFALAQQINLDKAQTHYLRNVLRRKVGDKLYVFNGCDGEFLAEIIAIEKNHCTISLIEKTHEQESSSQIELLFAPVKNVRLDFIAAKATELGVQKFQPILTEYTIVRKLNMRKFEANIIEAAEQCERLDLAELVEPRALLKVLKDWSAEKPIIWCDESGAAENIKDVATKIGNKPCAILIGPEGGFSEAERAELRKLPFVQPASLGKRILRSDTAIIASLAIVGI
jgi:16S rRNA (uracil1498-N3)-methyltransferase